MTLVSSYGVDLSRYNTLAIPAKAQVLAVAHSLGELSDAVKYAQTASLPLLVLGEGSNTVLIGDFPGLVVLNRLTGVKVVEEDASSVTVTVAAGENWHAFVKHCIEQGWHGLENLALIPGLVGAAPIQNIGAYGVEVSDRIDTVEVYDTQLHTIHSVANHDCLFAYRESRFKHDWAGQKIITAVTFTLPKSNDVLLNYPALKRFFTDGTNHSATQNTTQSAIQRRTLNANPSPKDVFEAVVSIRTSKLPSPVDIPNAGSFFKNPVVGPQTHQRLKAQYPELVSFKHPNGFKLAAAWLIDHAGWKQRVLGGVRVHQQQALVVTNPLRKDGHAIKKFALSVQKDIRQRYGVELEIEPRMIIGQEADC